MNNKTEIEQLINQYSKLADKYNVDRESIMFLEYSKAVKENNKVRSSNLREALQLARKPLRLVKTDNSNKI